MINLNASNLQRVLYSTLNSIPPVDNHLGLNENVSESSGPFSVLYTVGSHPRIAWTIAQLFQFLLLMTYKVVWTLYFANIN